MQDNSSHYDVIIAGGGLAGLTSAILLSKGGLKVLLLEKKTYPFHKVCGEYVSNEVADFFSRIGFDPFKHNASKIDQLRISTPAKLLVVADEFAQFPEDKYVPVGKWKFSRLGYRVVLAFVIANFRARGSKADAEERKSSSVHASNLCNADANSAVVTDGNWRLALRTGSITRACLEY